VPQLPPKEKLKLRLDKLPPKKYLVLRIITGTKGEVVAYGFMPSEEYDLEAVLEPLEETNHLT
jgi:hypothetical protein